MSREIIPPLPLKTPTFGTFSMVARDSKSGLFGVAVASGSTSVGGRVPYAKPGVGVVATQGYTNTVYGTRGLEFMEKGMIPREALNRVLREDPGREFRQVAIMDAEGDKAVFTGRSVPGWRGESIGKYSVAIGNLLAGSGVIRRMSEEFERSSGGLAWRMIRGLEAASESGGDRRGEFSAAIILVGKRGVEVEMRVDEHTAPIKELGRKLGIYFRQSNLSYNSGSHFQSQKTG